MKNLDLSELNLQELKKSEIQTITGGEDGDFLFGIAYGISWLLHEISENINDLPATSVKTWN